VEQLTCLTIENQTVCNDGRIVQQLGSAHFDNQGNSWLTYGKLTFNTSSTSFHIAGGEAIGTTPRICQRLQNLQFCN
jgi:hypothetical protein